MFYKVKQAAYLINTSDYHVEKLIKNGLLKAEKKQDVKRSWKRIPHESIREYLISAGLSLERIDYKNPYMRKSEEVPLPDLYNLAVEIGKTKSAEELMILFESHNSSSWVKPLYDFYLDSFYTGMSHAAGLAVAREYFTSLFNGFAIRRFS
jgi:hypothetical protein